MSNTSEPAKATDLVAILDQVPSGLKLEPRTRTPLIDENQEETTEEKIEEKRLTPISHLLVPEPDRAVALLAIDDVPELLLLGIGEICFLGVQDHHLADSPREEMTEPVRQQEEDLVRPLAVAELPIRSGLETTHPIHETPSVSELLHQNAATIGHDLQLDLHTPLPAMREEAATDLDRAHPQGRQHTLMTIGVLDDLRHHDQTRATRHADHRPLSIPIVPV